jgi:hypothetical protein
VTVTEDFIGTLRKVVDSVPTEAVSSKEILSLLDKNGIEWHVTPTGSLGIKYWQLFPGFVSEEDAADIRADRPSTTEGSKMDWLSENLPSIQERYAGQWIAIGDTEIVASAPTLPELLTQIDEIDKPFITFIPTEPLIWTLTYGIEKF